MGIRSVPELSACHGSAGPCCGKATTGGEGHGFLSYLIICCLANLSPLCPCSRHPPGPLDPTPYKMACTLSLKPPPVPRGWEAQAGAGDCTMTSDLGKRERLGAMVGAGDSRYFISCPSPRACLGYSLPTLLPRLWHPGLIITPVPSVIIEVDPWASQKYQQAPAPSPSFLGMRDRVGREGRISTIHLPSANRNPHPSTSRIVYVPA